MSVRVLAVWGVPAYFVSVASPVICVRLGPLTGFVMSDWGGTHSTIPAAEAGLDQEQPSDGWFGPNLLAAVQNGTVAQGVLDDKVLRILTSMYTAGIFDTPVTGSITANVTSDAHNALTRALAAEAIVLLKNANGLLPLQQTGSIAVIGDACQIAPIVHGTGSGAVAPPYVITTLAGMQAKAGGATIKYYATNDTGAVAGAKAANVAVICTATTSGEGHDRKNLSLPLVEDELIAAVAAAQPNTVVVVTSPGAVLLPWAGSVGAIISTFLPGQEAGNAIADVLFGDVNPSGKLPLTFPVTENPTNFSQAQYPGLPSSNPLEAYYSEKLLVGYRWFDANSVAVAFPFGHGLSYTYWKYSNLDTSGAPGTITAQITNAGSVAGAEVAQLYLAFPSASGEPPQVLKGFQKVFLTPGETATLTFPLMGVDVSVWDANTHQYVKQTGTFGVMVGSSSRDARLTGSFAL